LLEPLIKRVRLLVGRGIVSLINDQTRIQEIQVKLMANEVRADIQHFQPYGLTSHPKPGAEAVVLFHSGNRDHGLCVVVDDRRYRLKGLARGEVALYTDEGDSVIMRRNHKIDIQTGTVSITADAVNVSKNMTVENDMTVNNDMEVKKNMAVINGNLTVGGDIYDQYDSSPGATATALRSRHTEFVELYNRHTHKDNGMGPPIDKDTVPDE